MTWLGDLFVILGAVLLAWGCTLTGRAIGRARARRLWRDSRRGEPPRVTGQHVLRRVDTTVPASLGLAAAGAALLLAGTLGREALGIGLPAMLSEWLAPAISWFVGSIGAGLLFLGWGFRPAAGQRRCPRCEYDCLDLPAPKCPECGREEATWKPFETDRRSWGWIGAGVVLVLGSLLGPRVPYALRIGRPTALIPNWVLIAGYTWLPERLISSGADPSLYRRMATRRLSEVERSWLIRRCRDVAERRTDLRSFSRSVQIGRAATRLSRGDWTRFIDEIITDEGSAQSARAREMQQILFAERVDRQVRVPLLADAAADRWAALLELMIAPDRDVAITSAVLAASPGPGACGSIADLERTAMTASGIGAGAALWMLAESCPEAATALAAIREFGDFQTRERVFRGFDENPFVRRSAAATIESVEWLADADARIRERMASKVGQQRRVSPEIRARVLEIATADPARASGAIIVLHMWRIYEDAPALVAAEVLATEPGLTPMVADYLLNMPIVPEAAIVIVEAAAAKEADADKRQFLISVAEMARARADSAGPERQRP